MSQWCHPAISSSVVPFSSCPQSLPASESFPMSQLFTWGGQSIGVSALASFLPKKSQGWSPSQWTGWISLQSQGYLPANQHTEWLRTATPTPWNWTCSWDHSHRLPKQQTPEQSESSVQLRTKCCLITHPKKDGTIDGWCTWQKRKMGGEAQWVFNTRL